ncbi:MAG: FAD-binding oxidoreductase, partial [Holophagales bacterium]|nr:FAD-binding oxidoreductase [Holophagales bacterium]
IEVAPQHDSDLIHRAIVISKELVTPTVCRLRLEPVTPLFYHAGQFLGLCRPDGEMRSFSLASVPALDPHLEIHVKRVAGGVTSQWVHDRIEVGDELEFQGPTGRSCYTRGEPDRPLLLVGSGTGLAPLVGIVRDALHSGHRGPIHLYLGAREPRDHYARGALLELAKQHDNFCYGPCLSGERMEAGYLDGRAGDVAFSERTELEGWRVFLCGQPRMVFECRELALRAGADPRAIHADPHGSGPLDLGDPGPTAYPEPDPKLWAALDRGRLLTAILADFYDKVFDDTRLSRFFDGVTKARAIEKQYNFLYKVFTGEDVYMGDTPRAAHHWMVISDELFDYREELMAETMREHGLSEPMIRRWRAAQERYRRDIVKAEPFPKVIDGEELPLEGFGDLVLHQGGVCDICSEEIVPGESVRYHLRLGTTYCRRCAA